MRIIFLGFQTWGLVSLRAIHSAGHEVIHVVTHPDGAFPAQTAFTESVGAFAIENNIEFTATNNIDERLVAQLIALKPDVIVSSNWRRMIPARLLNPSRVTALNVHRSLLPEFAGVAPLNWAIATGAQETGVTIHEMLAGAFDAGPIVGQRRMQISDQDTATTLFHRSVPLVNELLTKSLAQLQEGKLNRAPQDRSQLKLYHSRGQMERRINWHDSWLSIWRLVRAQSDPFPNAFCQVTQREVSVKTCRRSDLDYRGSSSRVCAHTEEGGAIVLCGADEQGWQALEIQQVQVEGARHLKLACDVFRMNSYLGHGE